MNIPEGWKLVPVEPTVEMINAADYDAEQVRIEPKTISEQYRAMLAAAPTPPAQEINLTDVAMERIHEAAKNGRCKDFPPEYSGSDLVADICGWLSLPPKHEDQWQQAVLTECMAIEGCYKKSDPAGTLKCLIDWHVMNERDHAKDDEPVAWITESGNLYGLEHAEAYDVSRFAPLYTRPDNSELRKAAEEVCKRIEIENAGWVPDDVVQLRAELNMGVE